MDEYSNDPDAMAANALRVMKQLQSQPQQDESPFPVVDAAPTQGSQPAAKPTWKSLLGLKGEDQTLSEYGKANPGATVGQYRAAYPNARMAGPAPLEPNEDPYNQDSVGVQSTDNEAPVRGSVSSSGVSLLQAAKYRKRDAANAAAHQDEIRKKAEMIPYLQKIREQDPNYALGRQQQQAIYGDNPLMQAAQGGGGGRGYVQGKGFGIITGGGGYRPLTFAEKMAELKQQLEQQHLGLQGQIEATKEQGRNSRAETLYDRTVDAARTRAAADMARTTSQAETKSNTLQQRQELSIDKQLQKLDLEDRQHESVVQSLTKVVPERSIGGNWIHTPGSYPPTEPKKLQQYNYSKQMLEQNKQMRQKLQETRDAIRGGIPVDPTHIQSLTGQTPHEAARAAQAGNLEGMLQQQQQRPNYEGTGE